jgi:putative transposase
MLPPNVIMPGVATPEARVYLNNAPRTLSATCERRATAARFKSGDHAQGLVEVHGIIASHFRPRRHLLSAADYRPLVGKDFKSEAK